MECRRSWAPKRSAIDELLDLPDAEKVQTFDPLFSVRVAYQCPLKVTVGGKPNLEALPSTFEDALVFENLDLFSALEGKGLVKKFRDAIEAHGDAAALGQALFADLRSGKKAEFALDLLEIKEDRKSTRLNSVTP